MSEYFGLNLDIQDFNKLLSKDEFEEEPVPLKIFVEDRKFLGMGDQPLSKIQSEIVERSSQIYKLPSLIRLHGEDDGKRIFDRTVTEVISQLGKGSGKDHTARISMAYTIYKLHCLKDPNNYYNKGRGTYIDLINLAVNAAQAQSVFFQPLKNMLMQSPYFNEVGFEPRVSELFFYSKPIRCYSGHSESEGWEGYDVMTVVLDEIAAFKTDGELKGETRSRHSASQIYNMAKASVTSRFPNIGKVILLSFPRYQGDFIQQKYNEVAKAPDAHTEALECETGDLIDAHIGNKVWAIKAYTWQVNPTKTKEDFATEFIRDPIQARARFMCEPPEMEDAYFRDPDAVRSAFMAGEDPLNEDGTFKPWFNGRDSLPRFIHIDLALKKDRAALCMVHCRGYKNVDTTEGTQRLPVVKVDLLKYWEAGFREEINFASIRAYIFELNKRFNVVGVWFDKWQSADMIQTLHKSNIFSEWHGVTKKDYDSLSTCFYDGRIEGYWSERLVEEELLKLKIINNTKIDHPASGYKDGSDALAGAVHQCMSNADMDSEVGEIEIVNTAMDNERGWMEDEPETIQQISPMQRDMTRSVKQPKDLPEDLGAWLSGITMI